MSMSNNNPENKTGNKTGNNQETTSIRINEQQANFPILQGSAGKPVLWLNHAEDGDGKSNFGAALNAFTLDEGLRSTAFCKSHITFIDGEKGILRYRGYPIEQLAQHRDYLDVCYLLLNGELPSAAQAENFKQQIAEHRQVDANMSHVIQAFSRQAHPMSILISLTAALSSIYHEGDKTEEIDEFRRLSAIRLIAKIPTLVAMIYRHVHGKAFIPPKEDLSHAENFLHMLFAGDEANGSIDPALVRAMDHIFTLHADHEQNASTATVRLAGSTGADPIACISAGMSALWGPAHGGANEAVLQMLEEIGSVERVAHYLQKAKDANDPFRLMGFGHRVYKNYDPRARVMQKHCQEVLNATGKSDDPLFKLAVEMEKIASEDEYFVERKLYPNVDFYSGIILRAIGIPSNMFTTIFALSRSVGWIANWIEMMNDPDQGLIRPRQLYVGPTERNLDASDD